MVCRCPPPSGRSHIERSRPRRGRVLGTRRGWEDHEGARLGSLSRPDEPGLQATVTGTDPLCENQNWCSLTISASRYLEPAVAGAVTETVSVTLVAGARSAGIE